MQIEELRERLENLQVAVGGLLDTIQNLNNPDFDDIELYLGNSYESISDAVQETYFI